jgi:acetyltransferase-like isoleucine patch superfamily enzyme
MNQETLILAVAELVNRLRRTLDLANGKHHLAKIRSKGKGVGIWGSATISGHDHIVLGNNVHIGDKAYIKAGGGLTIGDNTHISRNLVLYTQNHRYDGGRIPYDETSVLKSVVIGRNVWIGMNVCITPGTKIGDGAIVGMGTVVSGVVPPMAIIGSQKWRTLAQRDEAHYNDLDKNGAYAGPNGWPYPPRIRTPSPEPIRTMDPVRSIKRRSRNLWKKLRATLRQEDERQRRR